MDDGWAGLVVLRLGDDHLREDREGSKDRATIPNGVLALFWGDDLDPHGEWSKGGDLLVETLGNALVHGGTTGENDVSVEILMDIDIALHDGVEESLVNAIKLHAVHIWFEEELWAAEALVADSDDDAIWKGVGSLNLGGDGGLLHLGVEVESDVAELLLDVTNDFLFGGGGEVVAALGEEVSHPGSEVTAGKVKTHDGVWDGVGLVNWDSVGNAITHIENDTGGTARAVKGKNGLDTDKERWDVEGVEHESDHLLTVSLRVEWNLSKKDWVLGWVNAEFVVEGVVPDHLHIVPVVDDTMLDWVLNKNTILVASFVTDKDILSAATSMLFVPWTTNNSWEYRTWNLITRETGLAHT